MPKPETETTREAILVLQRRTLRQWGFHRERCALTSRIPGPCDCAEAIMEALAPTSTHLEQLTAHAAVQRHIEQREVPTMKIEFLDSASMLAAAIREQAKAEALREFANDVMTLDDTQTEPWVRRYIAREARKKADRIERSLHLRGEDEGATTAPERTDQRCFVTGVHAYREDEGTCVWCEEPRPRPYPGLTVQDLDEYDEGTVISDKDDMTWVKGQGNRWQSVNGSADPIQVVHHHGPLRVAQKHGTGEPLSASDLEALHLGSIVVDRDGVEWAKFNRGWVPCIGAYSSRLKNSMGLVDRYHPIRKRGED